ncbi:MAG: LLM class flavin-dependent oxidoreductase, partial [Nocardioidaceae bacterium]
MSDHVAAASLAGGAWEPLRWGVLLQTFDVFGRCAPPVVAAARLAEDLGFDAVWAGDHLVARVPVLDSLGSLCAAAAVTSRVEVG